MLTQGGGTGTRSWVLLAKASSPTRPPLGALDKRKP